MTMAGMIRLIIVLWFSIGISTAESIAINGNDCKSERGIILKCEWRGEGHNEVDSLLREEILIMTNLTASFTVFVSEQFAGNVSKIEIFAPCRNVIAPLNVAVYISRKRRVSKFH